MAKTLEQRFREKVAPPDENGCELWTAATNRDGYGRFWDGTHLPSGPRQVKAHRASWELASGPIPADLEVDHVCGVRRCVSVAHLRLASRKENNENRAGLRKDNRSGFRGVTWNARTGSWKAQVGHLGQKHYLGLFGTAEAAGEAARRARNALFTHNDADREVAR